MKCLVVLFILGVYNGAQAVEPGLKLTEDGKFYIEIENEKTLEEAKAFCTEHKMKLVSLESKEKEATIVQHILMAKAGKAKEECTVEDKRQCEYMETCDDGTFWTSGYETTVNKTPRQFEWTGIGKPVEGYTNWMSGQPNNWAGLEERCLYLKLAYKFQVSGWRDILCKDKMLFICEK